MADLQLEGYTLGQKHQNFNRIVQDAIRNNKTVNVEDFNLEDSDVINLLNIDIASYNRNVQYILKVLTCSDMLYVSRAIKQSAWLINDQNYAHIINPKYLHTTLFPQMCTKAIIKLVKYIKNILNDQKRAEEFYFFEINPEEAVKWLPCCSLEFILKNMANHVEHMKTTLLKRLCEKSVAVLEIYIQNVTPYKRCEALQATMFLLPSNVDKFLDLVEDSEFPKFNKKATYILMQKNANRIINKFDTYYDYIHLPTFISCLKQENIKDFLLSQAQNINENIFNRCFNLNRLLLFIRLMPQEIRFEFVKEVFINRSHESRENYVLSEKEKKAMSMLCNVTHYLHGNNHIWYQFAPFNIALRKIQELLLSKPSVRNKISLLETVLTSTQNNLVHERSFLEYLRDKHKNTENDVKEKILKKLILQNNFVNYDTITWNILDAIFKGIDIYSESTDTEHVITEAIIIYNVIHEIKVSKIVENKFHFNSLVSYHTKLSESEKEMVFIYLYDLVKAKLTVNKITNEKEFKEKADTLELVLNLLKDYKKELENYPTIIYTIKDLVKLKNDLSLIVNIEPLFNIKKTWRKFLFEESFAFCQTESVLLNALKHGPSLIDEKKREIKSILCSDKISLRRVLGKIKIYWPSSLARNITLMYTAKLNALGDHNATTRGLSILLPSTHLHKLIEKYTPREAKVDWAKIDEVELSIQQQFAKNMHLSRPQLLPESILWFTKGDYLQYALPSLLSIFYNLNGLCSQKYIPKLLDAPVSLQKHGIRLAVSKLKREQLLCSFSDIWKNNKNASIRSVMFKTVYKLICQEKDSNKIKTTWQLIELFMDNITLGEDKTMYELLFNVNRVPLEISGQFYMKSYNLLHRLVNSGEEYKDYEYRFYTTFTAYSREIIEQLEPEFVVKIIMEFIANEFTKKETDVWSRGCVVSIISSYLLCASDELNQLERYKKVLLPIFKQSFTLWNTADFIRKNMAQLLNTLRCDIKKYIIDMKKANPHKMFLLIQEELYNSLETPANYMLLTKWKLTTTLITILNAENPIINWEDTCMKVANEFGNKCYAYLKEDCNKHFPRIYLLFAKALNSMLSEFVPVITYWDIYGSLIRDDSFTPGYLTVIILISDINVQYDEEIKKKFEGLCENILEHPSTEIKIHYYNQIKETN